MAATAPLPEVHPGAVTDEHIAFRRRQDGGYTLTAGGASQFYVGRDAFRHALKYLPVLKANPLGVRYAPAAPPNYPDAWSTPRKWEADRGSPFERMRILNPAPEKRALPAVVTGFRGLFRNSSRSRSRPAGPA